jgi:transposase-like protein
MSRNKRRFTQEERMQILREAEQHGVEETLRKHNLSRSLYYLWKSKFNHSGVDGLKDQFYRVDPAVRLLEKENERLRKIIAKQALELEIKEELLKKTKLL